MKSFDYAIAKTTQGAVKAAKNGYKIKASGIDILDMMKERSVTHDKIVGIHRLGSLSYIREEDGGIAIGALTTLGEIGNNDLIRRAYPAMARAAGDAATPQVRARATLSGNILQRPRCWYFRLQEYDCLKKGGATCFSVDGDNAYHALFGNGPCHITHPSNVAPTLVAANAQILVTGPKGDRSIDANEFFTLPENGIYKENELAESELVLGIVIPAKPVKSGYVEFREKQSFDWPLAACTAVYTGEKWSIVLSHVAPIPWRAEGAEEVLGATGDVDNKLAEAASEAALQGAKPMSQNAWRLNHVRASVRRAILQACGKDELA